MNSSQIPRLDGNDPCRSDLAKMKKYAGTNAPRNHSRFSEPTQVLSASELDEFALLSAAAGLQETDPLQEFDSILHRLGCIRLDNGSDGASLLANRIPLLGNDNDPAVRSVGGEKLLMKSGEVPHVQCVERPAFLCSEFKLLLVGRSLSPGLGSGQQIDASGP